MVVPLLVILALIGKWAYTNLIEYRNLNCTPSNKFWIWLQTVRRQESCLFLAKYILAVTFVSPFIVWAKSSIGKCLKLRLRLPCLPVTSTILLLIVILQSLGTVMDSSCIKVFIATKDGRALLSGWDTYARSPCQAGK